MHHIVINKSTAPTKRHVFAMLTKEIMRMRKESSAREDTVSLKRVSVIIALWCLEQIIVLLIHVNLDNHVTGKCVQNANWVLGGVGE